MVSAPGQDRQTYPEFVYEKAMMADLRERGIPCIRQDKYEIRYKDWIVGRQELDIFVAQTVVVELKVAERIKPLHLAQLMSYLKTVGQEVGLLFRFGGPDPEFERRVLTPSAGETSLPWPGQATRASRAPGKYRGAALSRDGL